MQPDQTSRRTFLGQASIGLATAALSGRSAWSAGDDAPRPVRFGICADVHKDIIHDADRRLLAFKAEVDRRRPDFVIQLGDFCVPKPENRGFLEIWNAIEAPKYHVLGNHDVDGGYSWKETMAYLGMERPYDSFDLGGVHFVVLDGNERGPGDLGGGYPRTISQEQVRWLADDLSASELPSIVFSHQSLENPNGVRNREQVREVLESSRRADGAPKVIACLSGHHHIDYLTAINGIHYVQINSMSYYWVGGDYARTRFDEATEASFPYVRYTVPYRDPLFAFAELDPTLGELRIEGSSTSYIPPGPGELGMPEPEENNRPSPVIRDRVIR